VSFGVSEPLQRSGIHTHRRFANNLNISWHAGKTVVSLAQNYHPALRVSVDDSRGLRHVIWSGGHCASYLFLYRIPGL
jgi:hypothetical protein